MRRLAAVVLALAAGCGHEDRAAHDPDGPEIGVVAVLPFVNQTATPFDADEFANILASEFVKLGHVRVIRPAQIRAVSADPIATADDAIRVGRRLKADAILACAVTDYDPYDPPKVAVSTQFLRVAAGPGSGKDLDRLLQSASWRRGPLTMSRDRAGHALAAFEQVWDAHDDRTRRALRAYARKRESDDSGFPREREFLAVQSRYLQFVSAQVVSRTLELMADHGS